MRVQWRLHGSTGPWSQGAVLSRYNGNLVVTTLSDENGAVIAQGPILIQYQGDLLQVAFTTLTNANVYTLRPAGWGQGVLYRILGGMGQRHWQRATLTGIDPVTFTETDTGEAALAYFASPYFTADGLFAYCLHTSGPDDDRPVLEREGAVEIRAGSQDGGS
jgi:hypothetical protein